MTLASLIAIDDHLPHFVWIWVYGISLGLLVYAQIVYPLVVVALGRKQRQVADCEDWPSVTLVIPAHNEEKVLQEKLENALRIDYPTDRLTIVVASDGSSDATNDIASSFADRGVVLLAFDRRRGKASVLNDAVSSSTSDVVCLCDANVMFQPAAVKHLVASFADDSIGAVSGDVQLATEDANFGEGESCYYGIEKRLQAAESQIGSLMGVDGGMYALRRGLFQRLPPDTILDDFVISMRVIRQGYRVVFEPLAIAVENGTPTATQEYRRRVRVAAGAMQSMKRGEWPPLRRVVEFWQYLSHKPLRWLGPLWLGLLLLSNVGLVESSRFFQLTLAQLGFYSVACLGLASLRFRATRVGGVVFYFVLSHVAMAVGMVKGIFNLQSVTWAQAERSSTTGSMECQTSK